MFKNSFALLSLSLAVLATTACGPKGPTKTDLANKVAAAIHDVAPTIGVTTAKLDTSRGGNWVVIKIVDGGSTQYLSLNLDLINMNMDWIAMSGAFSAAGANGFENVTPTGTYGNYYIGASGNVYEDTGASPKDLEKAAAAIEMVRFNNAAQSIAANYGLSEERSYHVAKLSMQWNKLSTSRSMTEADAEAFSKDLLGVNINDAQAAYINAQGGDMTSYNALMAQAAATNGVSPEQMSKIISQVIAQ